MRKYRVLVFGYLGYATNQLDGQTIKTRNIFELLRLNKNKYNYFLEYFDTQTLSKSKLSIFSMLIRLLRADKIFYLGAHKNLTFIFPFIYILSFIMRKEIYFIVVGGWLVEFLQNKPVHRFMLKRIVAIYPQTSLMVSQLCNEYGFSNVCQLHNFRIRNYNNLVYAPRRSKKIELVFMARVNPMKGVRVIFKLAEFLDKNGLDCHIDIYGPLLESYSEEFFNDLNKYQGKVSYLGVLQPEDIQLSLSKYDLMLFPTKYFTEGFPGTILDAYEAGLPVVATRWKYAEEYVEDGLSGLLCDFEDEQDFIYKVTKICTNPDLIFKLKAGAVEKSKEYSPEAAWDILSANLDGHI